MLFTEVCEAVAGCAKCQRMAASAKILSESSGSIDSPIMFIGEAPGRLGADSTGIPFHGDKAGHNFEELLEIAGLSRDMIYVTNCVLCNPKGPSGNNVTPNRAEIANCSDYLKRQIDIVNPKAIVTLGATALAALKHIEGHGLNLKEHVRTKHSWYGRLLFPLYHPGQRAMIHRSFANQQSDYRFVSDEVRRLGAKPLRRYGNVKRTALDLVSYILFRKRNVSYFALHKIVFIVEYQLSKEFGARYTGAYFIRQKDGPYCTDLHIQKIKNSIKKLRVTNSKGKLFLASGEQELFDQNPVLMESKRQIDKKAMEIVDSLAESSDQELKKKAYLSTPMRKILREERATKTGAYNMPIDFDVDDN